MGRELSSIVVAGSQEKRIKRGGIHKEQKEKELKEGLISVFRAEPDPTPTPTRIFNPKLFGRLAGSKISPRTRTQPKIPTRTRPCSPLAHTLYKGSIIYTPFSV